MFNQTKKKNQQKKIKPSEPLKQQRWLTIPHYTIKANRSKRNALRNEIIHSSTHGKNSHNKNKSNIPKNFSKKYYL